MHPHSLRQLLPTSFECGYLMLVTVIITLLGSGRILLERVGMINSADLLSQQVSTKITASINSFDTFRFTGSVVNGIIWLGTGLIVYSMIQAILRSMRIVAYEREFNSAHYVHPTSFTRQAYIRQVAVDTILGFLLLAALAVSISLYAVVALPTSFAYMRHFIVHTSFSTAFEPLISLAVAFIATSVVYFLLKLVVRHHRIRSVEA